MRPIRYTVTAADVTAGFTPPLPLDYMRVNGMYGLQYFKADGTTAGAGTFQQTLDDVFDASITPGWATVALTAGRAQVNEAVRAFRVGAGLLAGDVITIVAQGGSPGV